MTDAPPIIAPASSSGVVGNILRGLAAVLLVLVFTGLHYLGLLYSALFLALFIAVPSAVLFKSWSAIRRKLEFGLVRRPFRPETRRHLLQWFNRCLFWLLLALTLNLAVIPIQFERGEYRAIRWLIWGAVVVLAALEFFPRKRISLSLNLPFALGWLFFGTQLERIFTLVTADQCVVLDAPFRGEWYVFQGGRSAFLNHHYLLQQQRHALDLLKVNDGRTRQGDPSKLESYAAFGQDLLAPAEGLVVEVVNDQPDQPIGGSDVQQLTGNRLVIEIATNRFVMLAHLMKDSVSVVKGERVTRGQPVARCGNSGNTSEPHLHLQVQNRADFWDEDLKTLPILFRNVALVRGGRTQQLQKADVRRNDRIAAPINGAPS